MARAARSLNRVLAPGGVAYIATPIGRERVEFNAHRVLDPRRVPQLFPGLQLSAFSAVTDSGEFSATTTMDDLVNADFSLGLYELRKP